MFINQQHLLLTCVLLSILSPTIFARIVSRDEFVTTLRKHGIPESQLSTWACIAEHESRYDTSAYNSASGDHGIFQISQIYWCSPPGKGCGMSCASLRDNDINNDVECAKIIYKEHQRLYGNGFQAWTVYPQYCTNA